MGADGCFDWHGLRNGKIDFLFYFDYYLNVRTGIRTSKRKWRKLNHGGSIQPVEHKQKTIPMEIKTLSKSFTGNPVKPVTYVLYNANSPNRLAKHKKSFAEASRARGTLF